MNATASAVNFHSLPCELLMWIWEIVAHLKHNKICRNGARCKLGKNCPEAWSTDYAFSQVSREWAWVAHINPELFSVIRVIINASYISICDTNSICDANSICDVNSIPIDNSDKVAALVTLSGSEGLYLSIGCSPMQPFITTTTQLTLGGMADCIVSLCFDADNFRFMHALANVSLPKLAYVHLDNGREDYLFSASSHNLVDFLIWMKGPIQCIMCSHQMTLPVCAGIPWSSMLLLNLHGVHLCFKEDAVEVMLHLGVKLEEFRVSVDADSSNLGVPNVSFFSMGKRLGPLKHVHLRELWIEHHLAPGDAHPSTPPYVLFDNTSFSALRELHYSCTHKPHHNHITWLMQAPPSITTLDLDTHFLNHTTISSFLGSFRGLTSLQLSTLNSKYP
ncbi:hypothetical protein FA13DRAFT_1793029 [Coprinellus micaceus]|uniref:Uncharacterized protein n=1 Tax=Coprinellus micaceus TaxID=71717 RepID=A0A4Y7T6D1_COPMI|nr:hypothetical protein FA13DRAFT_1793029 [Coprinellus micaceus]